MTYRIDDQLVVHEFQLVDQLLARLDRVPNDLDETLRATSFDSHYITEHVPETVE